MRFRVWHLLAAMAFAALWVSLSQWLLRLEAMDHPLRPQTAIEILAFWLGSTTIAGLPLVLGWIAADVRRKRKRGGEAENAANPRV